MQKDLSPEKATEPAQAPEPPAATEQTEAKISADILVENDEYVSGLAEVVKAGFVADPEILRLVKRRSEVSQMIGRARMAAGGPRIVYSREMAVLARFDDLGVEGRELGMILLRLGRGRLGGR